MRPSGPPLWTAGGGASYDWTALTVANTDQGSGCSDPGGLTTSSSFVGTLATVAMAASATVVDGVQENTPRWTTTLMSLYPDYDPDLDDIELEIETVTQPRSGARLGIYAAIVNSGTLATGVGTGMAIHDLSASAHTISEINATSLTGSSLVAFADRLYCQIRFDKAASRNATMSIFPRKSDTTWTWDRNGSEAAFGNTPANWKLVIGTIRASGGAGGADTLAWRTWHRRHRRGDFY